MMLYSTHHCLCWLVGRDEIVLMLRKQNKWGKGFEQMYIFAYQGGGRWGIYNWLLKHSTCLNDINKNCEYIDFYELFKLI